MINFYTLDYSLAFVKKEKVITDSSDAAIDLALDTIGKNKQALIFVNSKRSAEKVAEDLARKLRVSSSELDSLSDKAIHVLARPTRQCERLGNCLKKGVSFHHAGLAYEQKDLIEESFRNGLIRIIAATPTLAMGMNLPAFRVIMRDVKRYTQQGYQYIPVLEYHQMCGRAGRPGYDTYGEAITVASSKDDEEDIVEKFIRGPPEPIYSKLAVEPVLRTYLLSLIASNFVKTKKSIMDFFEKTFWAFQFKDMTHLEKIISKMLHLLEEWDFISSSQKEAEFQSASDILDLKYRATHLGQRVAELYLDPLTAHYLCECLDRAKDTELHIFSWLQMVCHTLEMRPMLKVKMREYDLMQQSLARFDSCLLEKEPSMFEHNYEDFLGSIKTALFMLDWVEEKDEEFLLENYDIRPGEIRIKLDLADWLLYASFELARILELQPILKEIVRARIRVQYGVKEELLPLLKLKGIGRVRARILFANKIHDIGDIKKANIATITQLLGKQIAQSIKEQVETPVEPIKENKRKGQINLEDY